MLLKKLCYIETKIINPQNYPEEQFLHYSLPNFDIDKTPKFEKGSTIMSSKYIVPRNAILFNKLNVRFKRIWNVVNNDYSYSICSGELLPLVINNSCIIQKYLYYYLLTDKVNNILIENAHGTSISHQRIKPSDLLNIDVPVPSIEKQKHIVNIIGSIDDLIEKLQSENLLYINMGNEIFKSQPTKKHVKVKNVLTFQKGLEVGSQKYKNTKNDNTVDYYRVADLNNLESTTYVDSIFLKKAAAKFGDVMITFDGCPGRVGFSVDGCYSGSLRKIIDINNEYNNGYLFFWAISENVQNCIKEYSFGTTILHASKSIDHLEIMVKPCLKILNQLDIIFNKMTLNVLTIKALNKIKQMYLKKFFG